MSRLMSPITPLLVALALAGTAPGATATPNLAGDTVACTLSAAFLGVTPCGATATATVDSTVEFAYQSQRIDVAGSSITLSVLPGIGITWVDGVLFMTIGDLDFLPNAEIVGFEITSQSGVEGNPLDASDLSFSADSVSIMIGGTSWAYERGSTALLTILTREVGTVPEPGTLALLGLGLAGIAGLRHRKP